ncbi:uncharacterized protein LOC144633107 [Oculina patagonica]
MSKVKRIKLSQKAKKASPENQEPFKQLSNALDTLFESYDGLKLSLASLSKNVFNIAKDPKEEASKINIFGLTTKNNLKFYLDSLKDMSNAVTQEEFSECKEQASIAKDTMEALKDHVQAEGMFKALEIVINHLREIEQSKKKSSADFEKVIEKELEGVSSLVKNISRGLLAYIKEELHQALDDSKLFINADVLKKEVEKVKKTIPEVKKASDLNILTLGNIISTMDRLCDEGEHDKSFIKSLKSNAEALKKNCDEKLPSVSVVTEAVQVEAIKHENKSESTSDDSSCTIQ